MRVLVSGGSGFLGKAVVTRLLERGCDVKILCRRASPELVAMGAELIRGDVSNASAYERAAIDCDAVMHTASKVGAWGAYLDFYNSNVVGTENAISTCKKLGIAKLIYTSSPSVVHSGGDVEGVNESLPYPQHFEAHYPKTKAIAERRILEANSDELATIALRPHLIWGPGDTNLLPRFEKRYRTGRLRLASGPPKLVDTLYIDNAVDAHLLALDRLSPNSVCSGKAYFISNGEPLPIDQVINGVLGTLGLGPVKKRIAPWAAFGAGTIAEIVYGALRIRAEPPITRFVARQLSTAHWFDISAARRDLHYEPRVSFHEGLRLLEKWHKKQ